MSFTFFQNIQFFVNNLKNLESSSAKYFVMDCSKKVYRTVLDFLLQLLRGFIVLKTTFDDIIFLRSHVELEEFS